MPDSVSREQADYALFQLGYHVGAEEGGLVSYLCDRPEDDPLVFDFGRGPIPWSDFANTLEYVLLDLNAFCAYLEGM